MVVGPQAGRDLRVILPIPFPLYEIVRQPSQPSTPRLKQPLTFSKPTILLEITAHAQVPLKLGDVDA